MDAETGIHTQENPPQYRVDGLITPLVNPRHYFYCKCGVCGPLRKTILEAMVDCQDHLDVAVKHV